MVRHVLPVAVVLALVAGCGGKRDEAPQKVQAAPVERPAAPVVKAEPAPEKPRKAKKGEVAPAPLLVHQPAGPELPAAVDLSTTPEMLSAHALIVAREQVQAGFSDQADVTQRHAFLLASWQAPYQQRLATLSAVRDAREARAQRELAIAKLMAEHEQRLAAVDSEYAPMIRAEQAKTAPILDQ